MKTISNLSGVPQAGDALLYVGTSWCPYCATTVAAINSVTPEHEGLELLKIDGDDEPDVLAWVKARTYPQLLLYRNGDLVAQRESANEDTLRAWFAEHRQAA